MQVNTSQLVLVDFLGDERPPVQSIPYPLTLDDHGIVSTLMQWSADNHIQPVQLLYLGGGRLTALYNLSDGPKVANKLRELIQEGGFTNG